ncbi:tetratricopeptide repeat protein [Prochlorococcus marinus]|uniref:Uncharacterized protein n=1 Tax=Prochlorococcus marinus XMU1408 TaxID=2213228 RepID=A0A318QW10_PROMR|nr:tetratricopeptide repeat protein [Prochlorococcus marinus]PYE01066.1 hypothetical protein DNJ73_06435 [Prochlorococcus marinus XMU1408]
MQESENSEYLEINISELKIFTVPLASGEIKEVITNNISSKSYKEKILNQAFIFHSQGNISEAIKSYKNFISQGYKDPRVFSNYGDILKSLGKFKEAEITTRNAIELRPDFVGAHYNLGNILRALGKLQEAEESIRKAIELKPDFVEAHLHLAYLFQEKGDYQNSSNRLKYILKLKNTNTDDKLIVLGQLYINSIIAGSFDLFDQIINSTKAIYNKDNPFNKDNFIIKLGLELKENFESSNYSTLAHIGDSHCMSFSHQVGKLKSEKRRLIPIYIRGAKAWHFCNKDNNIWKASFTEQIKNHMYSNELLISFGEIDCRKEEGILPFSIKYNKDMLEVCKTTINGYLNYMENSLAPICSKRYYFGVPAPSLKNNINDDLDMKRIELVKIYNSILKKEVLSRGSSFIDVYGLTVNRSGENNSLYMCDEIHLSPKCLNILLDKYLFES